MLGSNTDFVSDFREYGEGGGGGGWRDAIVTCCGVWFREDGVTLILDPHAIFKLLVVAAAIF